MTIRILTPEEKAEIIRRVGEDARRENPEARPTVFVRDETDDQGRPIVMIRNITMGERPRA